MTKKIGRNDPCWCGSGKKYKKCHLNRENEARVTPSEVFSGFKKLPPKLCCAPSSYHCDCQGEIIKAHTISKKFIQSIAVDNHIYATDKSLNAIHANNGKIKYKKTGINNATVVTGFCKKHDNDIFEYIENDKFTYDRKTSFLLLYRAFCYEYYAKLFQMRTVSFNKDADKGINIEGQMIVQVMNAYNQLGSDVSLRENENYKKLLDECLVKNDYDSILSVSISIPSPPMVMCAGAIDLIYDMHGDKIFDDSDYFSKRPKIALNSFYDGQVGRFIFSCISEDAEIFIEFMNSLIAHTSCYANVISQYIIRNFENHIISPVIFENLDISSRDFIENAVNTLTYGFDYSPQIEIDMSGPACIETVNCYFSDSFYTSPMAESNS